MLLFARAVPRPQVPSAQQTRFAVSVGSRRVCHRQCVGVQRRRQSNVDRKVVSVGRRGQGGDQRGRRLPQTLPGAAARRIGGGMLGGAGYWGRVCL
jgi:hypothetical protein